MAEPADRAFPRVYPVYWDPNQGGLARTRKNEPPDEVQRENIHQSPQDRRFEVVVNLLSCIHGTLDERDKKPASLIIFEFYFAINKGSGRVRQARFHFEFHNKDALDSKQGPAIIAWAPFRFEERSNLALEQIELMKRLKMHMGADFLAQAGLTAELSKKLSYTDRYYDCGRAVRQTNAKGRFSNIAWNLYESKQSGHREGLKANFRAAVLLERPDDKDFVGLFRPNFDTGIWNDAAKEYRDWHNLTIPDDPVNFSPSQKPFNNRAGIDENNLGRYKDDLALRPLTVIPGLEDLALPPITE